ncbi:ATP-binding cassette domain-containing protein [Paenibacillus sp. FSL H8-0332]|uniref:ABC transporter ATP-binding protein n=1 Tax=Paenibacillus sp. FSL H8-0332 TaxID=2954742 RepID=UPI0030D57B6E
MPQIELSNVTKDYKIRNRESNRSIFKEFIRPSYTKKCAVRNINFTIEQGEMVGFIGPNGAGKSTTIKMLTGILTPSSGTVRVFGQDPCKNRTLNALKIGVLFGQRSQMLWDLPVRDTFEMFKIMYRIKPQDYKRQRDRLIEMLDMSDFLSQAVRQLSLGQRMRANLALSFLHQPQVVFLDEPTIGLDVLVKDRVQEFLKQINKEQNTTILLTTHDTKDIEEVAQRLVLIDKGKLLFDGEQVEFHEKYKETEYILEVVFDQSTPPIIHEHFQLQSVETQKHFYKILHNQMRKGEAISYVASRYNVVDIRVRESSLEGILKNLYK